MDHGDCTRTVECTYSLDAVDESGVTTCEDTPQMGSIQIDRTNGGSNQPKCEDITDLLRATGCLDSDASATCTNGDLQFRDIWICNIQRLLEYFWDYDNNGLKLMQVRFYETTSGQKGTVP